MIDRRNLLLAAVACLAPASVLAADREAAALVEAVDALRLPGPADGGAKITMRITDGEGAKRTVDKLSVLVRGESALVSMVDGPNRGMKVLGSPQGVWIYWPNTRRAMRLTPMQQLRGQASVGDISRLRFAEDYEAAFAPQKSATRGGRDCWAVVLKAKSQAATYATVNLWIAKSDTSPVEAEVFVASGRKLKSVLFSAPVTVSGRKAISTITYVDGIDTAKRTVVELLSAERANPPAAMFKPEALSTDF